MSIPSLCFCALPCTAMIARCLVAAMLLTACTSAQPAAGVTPSAHKPGLLADTWTRIGSAWHHADVAGPPPRYFAALAYDAPRHDYVLFGGQAAAVSFDDTWTWNGAAWTKMSPAHKPPPRRNAAMAYDPIHHVVVLYGGLLPDRAEGYEGGDSWTWDGTDWTQVGPDKGAPGPRQGARMVTTDDGVLLFGGHFANLTYYADAWTWNGAAWSAEDGGRRPPGRGEAAVAWDQARSSLFVFGGTGFNGSGGPGAQGTPLADTWIFAGAVWVSVVPAGPAPLAFANALWDAPRKRVLVLFGMACPNPTDHAWAWDGDAWSDAGTVEVPARWGAASAQDATGNTLLFGGSDEPGC